jgi:hypothetical protein
MAWCWCGSNFVPGAGLISRTLLRSRAAFSWRSVASAPSRICSVLVLVGQAGFQAVAHGQQAVGEAFHRVLAGLGDFFLGAAAGVLHLGLGAQELVGQFGVLGVQGTWACQSRRRTRAAGVVGGRLLSAAGRLLRRVRYRFGVVGDIAEKR